MILSPAELDCLREICATMIPTEGRLPGADDPAILADIVKSIGRDLPAIRQALADISRKAEGEFAALDQTRREETINAYFRNGDAAAAMLSRLVLGAYYRDDRVLVALGLEARAPFPKGHVVEQGEWSLLERVKQRAPFWRRDRAG